MKRRLLTVLLVVLVALMAVGPAFAYTGISGTVTENKTGGNLAWIYGGTVTVQAIDLAAPAGLVLCGAGSLNVPAGTYNFSFASGCTSQSNPYYVITLDLNAGPNGKPAAQTVGRGNGSDPLVVDFVTNTGPTAVELTDFSVAPQANNWLPFVLLIGSVALVGGAVTLLRKRRA